MPPQAEQFELGTDDEGFTYVVERLAKPYQVLLSFLSFPP
jgi:hypothetical protein